MFQTGDPALNGRNASPLMWTTSSYFHSVAAGCSPGNSPAVSECHEELNECGDSLANNVLKSPKSPSEPHQTPNKQRLCIGREWPRFHVPHGRKTDFSIPSSCPTTVYCMRKQ